MTFESSAGYAEKLNINISKCKNIPDYPLPSANLDFIGSMNSRVYLASIFFGLKK
jgi:hypothetical protein